MKKKKIDIWMITNIAVMLGESCDTEMDNCFYWHLDDDSMLELDFNTNEVRFVNWVGDSKTYYSIIGIATLRKFTHGDYFTEK